MKINDRLRLIGDLLPDKSIVLDVGCDHALLDIYAVKLDKDIKMIASDIAEGPVNAAKENIKREKMSDKIEVRLGNGLDTYTSDINTVVISGMGGRLMISIFKNHLEYLKTIDTIILSPNNYQEDVKRFLTKNGYYIDNEELVRDKKYIYQVLVFKKGKRKYKNKDYFFGPVLLTKKNDLFKEYFGRELASRKITISMLPKKYYFKRYKVNKEIKMLEAELN